MKIYNNIFEKQNVIKAGIISIGFFDSMHLGHKKVIKNLLDISNKNNLENYILTYSELPTKETIWKKVIELNDRLQIIKNMGIKNVILSNFNNKFSKLKPDEFIKLLKENFNIKQYLIRDDFHFGFNKNGNIKNLEKAGCEINLIEPIYINDQLVSTSNIKKALSTGNIETANSLLGYNYYIVGMVKKGKQLGRRLGFPTMNFYNNQILIPQEGVYLTKTHIKEKTYYSMTYVCDNTIETYLIGYDKFHYNFKIRVDFFKKIRDNATFQDLESLKVQLEKDLLVVIDYFKIRSNR